MSVEEEAQEVVGEYETSPYAQVALANNANMDVAMIVFFMSFMPA